MRPCAWFTCHLSSSHNRNLFYFLCFFPVLSPSGTTCSCTAHSSTRHTVAHRPVNAAAALVPQGAYRSLSRRFHRHQIVVRMTLEYGPWTSCRSVRWEAGHRTGRTCESLVVIFDQAHDIPNKAWKNTRSFCLRLNDTRYTLQSRIC